VLVAALAARRSWFCYQQLSAVLLEFERRRTGLAAMVAPGRGVFLDVRLRVLRQAAVALVLAWCRTGPGRPWGGGG